MSSSSSVAAFIAVMLIVPMPAVAAPLDVQDRTRTPGVTDTRVSQDNIGETICTSGYTATVRPPAPYTNALKASQLADWGYDDPAPGDYEEDHLISLEIGGSPTAKRNLWPEPYAGDWGAKVKDTLENELKRRVCLDQGDPDYISLRSAQRAIADNWIEAYSAYVCTRRPALSATMKQHCASELSVRFRAAGIRRGYILSDDVLRQIVYGADK